MFATCPTHHSTGPARKAAQAGEFRRWAYRHMRSICKKYLTVLFMVAAFLIPHHAVAANNEPLATCNSRFVQGLLSASMVGLPRDDVWILLALDKVKIIDACRYLDITGFSNYLERLWLNDVIGEVIPVAKTMADAVRIENDISRTTAITLEKLRQRAHTMSFSIEIRKPTDTFPQGVDPPHPSDIRKARNIWPSRFMSPPGIAVALAFTNTTQRNIYWPNTDLFIRRHSEEKHVWFHCESERRDIAPLERFVIFCATNTSSWTSDDEGLALLEGLNNRDNWFLRPNDTRHNWPAYQRIMHELSTQQSAQKAIDYVSSSSCTSRGSCSEEFDRSPLADNLFVKFLKFWMAWLPGLVLGAVLFAVLRRSTNASPKRIALVLSGAMIAAAGSGLYAINNIPGVGLGGVFLMIVVIVVCIGGLLGVWLLYMLSTFRGRRDINDLTASVLKHNK
jgi:hypothetical protein